MFSLRAAHIAGQSMEIKRFGVRDLLPETKHYMTYDGSTTMPACHETTTWIILNKPIYITKQQVRERERDSLYDVLCACRCNFEGSIYIYILPLLPLTLAPGVNRLTRPETRL